MSEEKEKEDEKSWITRWLLSRISWKFQLNPFVLRSPLVGNKNKNKKKKKKMKRTCLPHMNPKTPPGVSKRMVNRELKTSNIAETEKRLPLELGEVKKRLGALALFRIHGKFVSRRVTWFNISVMIGHNPFQKRKEEELKEIPQEEEDCICDYDPSCC